MTPEDQISGPRAFLTVLAVLTVYAGAALIALGVV